MHTKRDWQNFERKILDGRSVEDAAMEAGIPLEAAEEHLRDRIKRDRLEDVSLIKQAKDAASVALRILKDIAEAGPRAKQEEDATDFQAARVMLDFSLKARKMVRDSVKSEGGTKAERDLFDVSVKIDVKGPWDLTDPGDI